MSGLTLGTIIALTTLLIVSVAIAQPNPGHSADQIGPGTFQGGGNYIFPSTSTVVIAGGFRPSSSSVDLGSSSYGFRSLYLSGAYGTGRGVIYNVFRILSPQSEGEDLWIGLTNASRSIGFYDYAHGSYVFHYNGSTQKLYAKKSLDVSGDIYSSGYVRGGSGLCIGSDCRTSWPSGIDGSGSANKIAIWQDSDTLTYDSNLHWDNTNNRLGIGTSSPAYRLDVNGETRIIGTLRKEGGGDLIIKDQNGVAEREAQFYNIDGVLNIRSDLNSDLDYMGSINFQNGLLFLDGSSSKVGIGTTSPSYKLDVDGNARITSNLGVGTAPSASYRIYSSGGSYGIRADGSTMGGYFRDSDGTSYAYLAYGSYGIYAGGKAYFSGNVGIGDPTPDARLDVSGGDIYVDSGKGLRSEAGDLIIDAHSTGRGTVYMYDDVSISGNLGIGTDSPGGRLDLGQVSDRPVIKWNASGGREYGIEPYDNRFILADLGHRRILEADPAGWTTLWGNVGIGTTSPGGKLAVRQDDDGTPFLIRLQNLKSGNEADFTLKAGGGKFIIGDEIKTAERFIIDENGGVIIKSGILLGGTGSFIANFLDLGDVDHEPRYIFCMQKVGPIDWVNYQPCGNKEWWIANIYGYLLAPTSGTYYFYVTVDDGFALFIDGALCKASWKEQGATEYSCSKYLTKGWHPIFLQHLQTKTDERLKLEWKRPGGSRELIPSTYMAFPPIWGLGFTGAVKH